MSYALPENPELPELCVKVEVAVLIVLNNIYGLCGRKATLRLNMPFRGSLRTLLYRGLKKHDGTDPL